MMGKKYPLAMSYEEKFAKCSVANFSTITE